MNFLNQLDFYKTHIDDLIASSIHLFGPKSLLRDACEYALLNGGKRFRPLLVLMIAKGINPKSDVRQAALAVEFFHTASLIADDLPCMDNDLQRRNKPSLHCMYGESTALLCSYALIAEGYHCIARNSQLFQQSKQFSNNLCIKALENISANTGISGATGGQYIDLNIVSSTKPSFSEILIVLQKKTVTLFEISFVLGWLFGGGHENQLEIVKKSAAHFGMAFQIADDLMDQEEDFKQKRVFNVANAISQEKAIQLFHEEIENFNSTLVELKLENSELNLFSDYLNISINHHLSANF